MFVVSRRVASRVLEAEPTVKHSTTARVLLVSVLAKVPSHANGGMLHLCVKFLLCMVVRFSYDFQPFDPRLVARRAVKEKVDLPPHMEPYIKDVVRGQLCAFMIGYAPFVLETRVAVESIVHFMPGMRIAIAAHFEDVPLFERCDMGFVEPCGEVETNGDWRRRREGET